MPSKKRIERFKTLVWSHSHARGRDMPWRRTRDPYRILVSEFMLQQTQVERVKGKYGAFLKAFPTVRALARASLADVLTAWQGLGYNRRARNLTLCARRIVDRHGGKVPRTMDELLALPGVGQSTAGAVIAFAFNLPSVFIETNIRAAIIDFFFPKAEKVGDGDIAPLLEAVLDRKNPREWYYALFDYGAHLKSIRPGIGTRSSGYKKQSKFEGSRRQARGAVLRCLAGVTAGLPVGRLAEEIGRDVDFANGVVEELEREGLVAKHGRGYRLAE